MAIGFIAGLFVLGTPDAVTALDIVTQANEMTASTNRCEAPRLSADAIGLLGIPDYKTELNVAQKNELKEKADKFLADLPVGVFVSNRKTYKVRREQNELFIDQVAWNSSLKKVYTVDSEKAYFAPVQVTENRLVLHLPYKTADRAQIQQALRLFGSKNTIDSTVLRSYLVVEKTNGKIQVTKYLVNIENQQFLSFDQEALEPSELAKQELENSEKYLQDTQLSPGEFGELKSDGSVDAALLNQLYHGQNLYWIQEFHPKSSSQKKALDALWNQVSQSPGALTPEDAEFFLKDIGELIRDWKTKKEAEVQEVKKQFINSAAELSLYADYEKSDGKPWTLAKYKNDPLDYFSQYGEEDYATQYKSREPEGVDSSLYMKVGQAASKSYEAERISKAEGDKYLNDFKDNFSKAPDRLISATLDYNTAKTEDLAKWAAYQKVDHWYTRGTQDAKDAWQKSYEKLIELEFMMNNRQIELAALNWISNHTADFSLSKLNETLTVLEEEFINVKRQINQLTDRQDQARKVEIRAFDDFRDESTFLLEWTAQSAANDWKVKRQRRWDIEKEIDQAKRKLEALERVKVYLPPRAIRESLERVQTSRTNLETLEREMKTRVKTLKQHVGSGFTDLPEVKKLRTTSEAAQEKLDMTTQTNRQAWINRVAHEQGLSELFLVSEKISKEKLELAREILKFENQELQALQMGIYDSKTLDRKGSVYVILTRGKEGVRATYLLDAPLEVAKGFDPKMAPLLKGKEKIISLRHFENLSPYFLKAELEIPEQMNLTELKDFPLMLNALEGLGFKTPATQSLAEQTKIGLSPKHMPEGALATVLHPKIKSAVFEFNNEDWPVELRGEVIKNGVGENLLITRLPKSFWNEASDILFHEFVHELDQKKALPPEATTDWEHSRDGLEESFNSKGLQEMASEYRKSSDYKAARDEFLNEDLTKIQMADKIAEAKANGEPDEKAEAAVLIEAKREFEKDRFGENYEKVRNDWKNQWIYFHNPSEILALKAQIFFAKKHKRMTFEEFTAHWLKFSGSKDTEAGDPWVVSRLQTWWDSM